jgi:hypothetical protein
MLIHRRVPSLVLTYRKIKRTFATAPAGNVEWLQRHGSVSRVFPPYPSVNIFA